MSVFLPALKRRSWNGNVSNRSRRVPGLPALTNGDALDPAAAHQPRSPGATAQKTRRGGTAAAAPVERGAREALSGAASAPCPRGGLRGSEAPECARRLAHVRASPPADAFEGQDGILPFKGTVREVMLMDNGLTMHPPLRKPPSSASPCFLYSFPIKHSGDFSPFYASNF